MFAMIRATRSRWLSVLLLFGACLLIAGWLVDALSSGDPHVLSGVGWSVMLLAIVVWASKASSGERAPQVFTPSRRVLVASLLLAGTVAGVLHAFIDDRISFQREPLRLVESPLRELSAVTTFGIVFFLARTVLLGLATLPKAQRGLSLLLLSGWATSSVLAVLISAVAVILWLSSQQIFPSLRLVLTLSMLAATLAVLTTTATVLRIAFGRTGSSPPS